MSQGPLCPNLSQKVQKEVSQMANCNLPRAMLRWFKCKLKPPKNWYLSKRISFLKCPLVPTFLLLIKARRCDQKNGNVFSQGPIRLGVFCPHFKSDIRKHNRRLDVKLHNILFILFFIKKEKMK